MELLTCVSFNWQNVAKADLPSLQIKEGNPGPCMKRKLFNGPFALYLQQDKDNRIHPKIKEILLSQIEVEGYMTHQVPVT